MKTYSNTFDDHHITYKYDPSKSNRVNITIPDSLYMKISFDDAYRTHFNNFVTICAENFCIKHSTIRINCLRISADLILTMLLLRENLKIIGLDPGLQIVNLTTSIFDAREILLRKDDVIHKAFKSYVSYLSRCNYERLVLFCKHDAIALFLYGMTVPECCPLDYRSFVRTSNLKKFLQMEDQCRMFISKIFMPSIASSSDITKFITTSKIIH